MYRRVRRNPVEDGDENSTLQVFQARLRRFNEANAAGSFRQHAVVVVFKPGLGALVSESLKIGQPAEFRRSKLEPIR
jgi:hypothetical protein